MDRRAGVSSRTMAIAALCGAVLAAMSAFAGSADPNPQASIGKKIENFTLPDAHGKPVSLSDFKDKEAVVIIFVGTECPISNRYLPILNKLHERWNEKAAIIGINSLTFNTPEMIAEHYEDFEIKFPVLRDGHQQVLLQFDAERTPDCFVLDKERVVRYFGRIDDRTGYTYKRDEPSRRDLEEAIHQVVEGEDVTVPITEVMGCIIVRDPEAQLAELD